VTTIVLSNPNGRRARKQIPQISRLLKQLRNKGAAPRHEVSSSPSEAETILSQLSLGVDDCLIIHGGDGTVQHAVSTLLQSLQPDQLPIVAILPGGTTNMTANAINASRSLRRCLPQLASAHIHGASISSQPALRIETSTHTIHGFFFGVGAIVHGIRYFHQHTDRLGLGYHIAFARALWGIFRGHPTFAHPVTIEQAGTLHEIDLLIVSVLDHLIFGTRPFWGQEPGCARLTHIEHAAEDILQSLPLLLRGQSPSRRGYHSQNIDQIELIFDDSFTVDGELFETAGAPITITATTPLKLASL
jgi:diacylglycerol kinase (ATP)